MRILDRFARTKRGTLCPRCAGFVLLLVLLGLSFVVLLRAAAAQAPQASSPVVPDWALPASATHKQVPPPRDFHRPTKTFPGKIGIFDAQSDIGSPFVPGSASYNPATGTYIVNSAGYNIWYTRDEFRFLWKKMSGDISFAANVGFPVPQDPPRDRKVVMVIRQDLDDDSKEAMVAEHGSGMVHLAQRLEKGEMMGDTEYRIAGRSGPDSKLTVLMPQRIGIEKHGDEVSLWVSVSGEPMHQFGPPIHINFKGPFYVGLGFCSHYPVTLDSGSFSHVILEKEAGRMH